MTYSGIMDKECVRLCDAINAIPGLETVESCCGHGKDKFRIWFYAHRLDILPILLYFTMPCHVGFRWHCTVQTDCGMSPVVFRLESEAKGDVAYRQADRIADEVEVHLAQNPSAFHLTEENQHDRDRHRNYGH